MIIGTKIERSVDNIASLKLSKIYWEIPGLKKMGWFWDALSTFSSKEIFVKNINSIAEFFGD